jgi:hypothetical protein
MLVTLLLATPMLPAKMPCKSRMASASGRDFDVPNAKQERALPRSETKRTVRWPYRSATVAWVENHEVSDVGINKTLTQSREVRNWVRKNVDTETDHCLTVIQRPARPTKYSSPVSDVSFCVSHEKTYIDHIKPDVCYRAVNNGCTYPLP